MADLPGGIKEDLSHVRWICGSSCSGKTTIAKKLAIDCDIEVYHMDNYFGDQIRNIAREKQPYMYRRFFSQSFYDSVLWSKEKRRALNIGMLQELFCLTVENLRHFGQTSTVLVEGLLLPDDVCKVSPTENAVCIAVTDEFYPVTFGKRMKDVHREEQRRPSEGEEWLRTWLESERKKWVRAHPDDAHRLDEGDGENWTWLRDRIVEGAQRAGIGVITNDGSKGIDELTATVREQLKL